MDSNTCKQCGDTCATCSSLDKCLTCPDEYELADTICLKCESDEYIEGDTCEKCGTNCELCENGPNQCLQCTENSSI